MSGFDQDQIVDALYAALAADASLTALLGNGSASIWHKNAPRSSSQDRPLIVYYIWDELIHGYTLGKGRSDVTGSYRVTAWVENDPRLASSLAKKIDNALTNQPLTLSTYGLLVCRCKRTISRVQEHDDTLDYHEAGGIYEIGVTV